MSDTKMIDHLFRHQYGKMVSILTRIFGLQHLDTVEDAVQDTFITAIKSWRSGLPENPEAWLTVAAKNRVLDIFRKLSAEKKRVPKWENPQAAATFIGHLFLESEIRDSQLRMIFAACNPALKPPDQIAFALKTVSGFSAQEIASALLLKEETVKKRLTRARKTVGEKDIQFEIPQGKELPVRLSNVLEVVYLIFNEGFHSNKKDILIREDLCGEALRMCKLLLQNDFTKSPEVYALFALFCFHSSRLKSKVNSDNEIISLKKQDRSKWNKELTGIGHAAMERAVETETFGAYHFEAAIAAEHLKAKTYTDTDWDKILMWYQRLEEVSPSHFNVLNMAVIHLEKGDFEATTSLLEKIDSQKLEQREYLFYGVWAEFYYKKKNAEKGIEFIAKAIDLVRNDYEKKFLLKKKQKLEQLKS